MNGVPSFKQLLPAVGLVPFKRSRGNELFFLGVPPLQARRLWRSFSAAHAVLRFGVNPSSTVLVGCAESFRAVLACKSSLGPVRGSVKTP